MNKKLHDSPKGYLSYSQLKAFAKSPNHYLAYLRQDFKPTAKMQLGTAVHTFVLEPDQWAHRYMVQAKADRRTTAGKELAAQQDAELNGRTPISMEDFGTIQRIAEAIERNRFAMSILRDSKRETVMEGEIKGYLFKAVADIWNGAVVADLKTCEDASPDGFQRAAYNLDYHMQAAIYRLLFDAQEFYWIAAETASPYNVQVYQQSAAAKAQGTERLLQILHKFDEWDGSAEGYSDDIITLNLPKWA